MMPRRYESTEESRQLVLAVLRETVKSARTAEVRAVMQAYIDELERLAEIAS